MSHPLKLSRVLICTILCSAAISTSMAQQAPTMIVKVFRIRYAEPAEISAAVQKLLSNEGSITVQPAQRRITVKDQRERIDQIAKLIAHMDVQPQNFRLQVTLLRGVESLKKDEVPFSVSARLQKMFPFKAYSEIGRAELQGRTGDTLELKLDKSYRLELTAFDHRRENLPFGIASNALRLDLSPVILQMAVDGQKPRQILKTRVVLSENQELSIGAGISENAREGLVLVLKALPAEKN